MPILAAALAVIGGLLLAPVSAAASTGEAITDAPRTEARALADPCNDPQSASSTVVAGFEVDGNLCVNTDGSLDWTNPAVGSQPVGTDGQGADDTTAFTGGATESVGGNGGWPWSVPQTQGSNPASGSDINHVYAFSQVVDDEVFAYLGWDRRSGTGSAGFYVELNQAPNRFGPVPERTDGDLRLRFNQEGNTLLLLDSAATWLSTGPDSGIWVPIPVRGYAAQVNAQPVANLDGQAPDPLAPGTFAEVAVNLSALFAGTAGCSGRFGTINLRSVSNVSATSPGLQDWVAPIGLGIPPTCASVMVDKQWTINGRRFRNRGMPPGFIATLALTDPTGTRTGLSFGQNYGDRADGSDFEQDDPITIEEDVTVPSGCTTTPGGDLGDRVLADIGINHFTVTNTVTCPAFVTLEKSADPTTFAAPGTPITYTYDVVNGGDTTLTDVLVTDPQPGLSDITCEPAQGATLDPAETMTCTAARTTTQADVDAGQVTNTGTVTGRSPTNIVVIDDDDATVTAVATPGIGLVKSARPAEFGAAGEEIVYTYEVTNTGNVTLRDIAVADDPLGPIDCPQTVLAPASAMVCTAIYTTTPADVDGGPITNTGTATGTPPAGPAVTAVDRATITPIRPPPPRGTPQTRTHTSRDRVVPGERFHDRVRIRGLVGGRGGTATARLYGPFPSPAAAVCRAPHLARAVTWHVHNGATRSPDVRIQEPGIYTWRVTTHASAANRSATHPCGLAAETTVVAKPAYPAPIVDGGFSGTLGGADHARRVPTVVRMPAIGLRAPVYAAGVRSGRMRLPGDVSDVGWLRRSAGSADAIGTTVIAGHVSDRHDQPGAMYHLGRAHRGQRITITRTGTTSRFRVVATATYPRTQRLPHRYFATGGRHRLVLISCTDRVVYPDGHFHYTRYQVVVADAIAHRLRSR